MSAGIVTKGSSDRTWTFAYAISA